MKDSKENRVNFFERFGLTKRREEEPEIEFKGYQVPQPAPAREEETAPVREEEPRADAKANVNELKIMRPESPRDVSAIADNLLDGCTVFLNLELLEADSVTRMLDFLRGVTYAVSGQIKQTSATTYIITPNDVDITEDQK